MTHRIKGELARGYYDHLTRQQDQERTTLEAAREAIRSRTMTQEAWDALTPAIREKARDNSGLHPLLIGLEGWRVEALMRDPSTISGWKPRRFIVGKSTGWVPCHLAMRKGARGSSDVITNHTEIRQVRKLEQVR